MRVQTLVRTLSLATLVVVATTGCHWFGKDKGAYAMAPEARPLEVPPDLDRPAVDAAMKMPPTASATAPSAPNAASGTANAASPIGFTVPGERDAVFAKVGDALAATEGVKIASKAQILGTYDINYAGSRFPRARDEGRGRRVHLGGRPAWLAGRGRSPAEADGRAQDRPRRLIPG
jgi:hypothetical protein